MPLAHAVLRMGSAIAPHGCPSTRQWAPGLTHHRDSDGGPIELHLLTQPDPQPPDRCATPPSGTSHDQVSALTGPSLQANRSVGTPQRQLSEARSSAAATGTAGRFERPWKRGQPARIGDRVPERAFGSDVVAVEGGEDVV